MCEYIDIYCPTIYLRQIIALYLKKFRRNDDEKSLLM